VADNQNGLGNRPDHERASYPRFVLVDETECGDWVVVFVANPELRKASFGYIRLNWFKSVSHFSDPLPRIWLPQLHSTRWTGAVGQDGLKTFSGNFPDKLVVSFVGEWNVGGDRTRFGQADPIWRRRAAPSDH
jgi:hypothetical protein